MNIIWEDSGIIMCEKPVGALSQPGPDGGESMLSLLAEYRRGRGEPEYIAPIHRLDRGVGGLMVFAKDKKMAAGLSQLIQQHQFIKEYRAVVHGIPPEPQGEMTDLLFRDTARNKTFVVQRERRGVREAKLDYTLLATAEEEGSPLSLVQVRLYTGRTHQVRVQFASRRMPLVGDGKYGGRDNGVPLALWSYRLSFCHPKTGALIDEMLPPPATTPWNLFPV